MPAKRCCSPTTLLSRGCLHQVQDLRGLARIIEVLEACLCIDNLALLDWDNDRDTSDVAGPPPLETVCEITST
jgi:hypothetical protein